MTDFSPFLEYGGKEMRDILDAEVPASPVGPDDFFLYVMGPFTMFDLNYVPNMELADDDQLDPEYVDDPLFNPDDHTTGERGSYEAALADLCSDIRSKIGARAFLATDIGIPTPARAASNQQGRTPLSQSISFAAVSDAVIFIYSHAALNAGVGTEMGAILSEFNLRPDWNTQEKKPRPRFRVFYTPYFSSATVNDVSTDFVIDDLDFSSRDELLNQIEQFVVGVQRATENQGLPIWID